MFECGGQNWSVSMLTWTLFTVIFFLGGGGGGGNSKQWSQRSGLLTDFHCNHMMLQEVNEYCTISQ